MICKSPVGIPKSLLVEHLADIGFEGLGIMAVLYHIGSASPIGRSVNIGQMAKAGGKGYKSFRKELQKLEDLGLIEIKKPQGVEKLHHTLTTIRIIIGE